MTPALELPSPVVQAPMAGGPSTPALVAAVAEAGGLGFLAAGYAPAEAIRTEIADVRRRSPAPFGVNLFVPERPASGAEVVAYARHLRQEATRYGVGLPEPTDADDDDGQWEARLAVLVDEAVPVVSFTFGLPEPSVVRELHRSGSVLMATVTSVTEARAATVVGVDALCVQGPGAGGHRGTHDQATTPGSTSLVALLAEVRRVSDLPLLAAGGLATPDDVAEVLAAGAVAAQLGTLYLRTPESGASPVHKAALADPAFTTTVVTRAFSGRWARALRNRFVDDHERAAPAAFPAVHRLTAPLRAAAAAAGDPHGMSLWAGTAWHHATDEAASTVTERLLHGVAARR